MQLRLALYFVKCPDFAYPLTQKFAITQRQQLQLRGKQLGIKEKINRATVHHANGEFDQSVDICQQILSKKPKLFDARQLLALCYHGKGELDLAIQEFKHALTLNDKHAASYNNLGNVYAEAKQYQLAQDSYRKSLRISPNQADALNNLANCLQKTSDFQAAEDSYKKAILIDGSKADFHDNLGVSLMKQGKFEEALPMHMKALELNASHSPAYIHLFDLLMFMHRYQDALEIADTALNSQQLHDAELCELLIGKAKLFWLFGEIDLAHNTINLSHSIQVNYPNYPNVINLRVYHGYIEQLIKFKNNHPHIYQPETDKEIYFISESHGFSPCGVTINFNAQLYKLRSLLITGCKIFHLVNDKANEHQASLVTLLNGLPAKSKVVFAFGEIDCRTNEGIFHYFLQSGEDYHQNIDRLLTQYVELLVKQASQLDHEIMFYGVPAPHPEIVATLSSDKQPLFIDMIDYFNQKFRTICEQHQLHFFDIYQTTNASDETNRNSHMDSFHITPLTVKTLLEAN